MIVFIGEKLTMAKSEEKDAFEALWLIRDGFNQNPSNKDKMLLLYIKVMNTLLFFINIKVGQEVSDIKGVINNARKC